jgi:hypothetical protein
MVNALKIVCFKQDDKQAFVLYHRERGQIELKVLREGVVVDFVVDVVDDVVDVDVVDDTVYVYSYLCCL